MQFAISDVLHVGVIVAAIMHLLKMGLLHARYHFQHVLKVYMHKLMSTSVP